MRTLVRAGQLVGATQRILAGSSVLLEDGLIKAILDPAESIGIQVDSTLDFSKWTVLPGLIDVHVHLVMGGGTSHEVVREQVQNEAAAGLLSFRVARNSQAALQAGLTTVRDLGDRDGVTLVLRRAARTGLAEAPDLVLSGPPITCPQGHLHEMGVVVRGVDEARTAVAQLVEAGVDQIKVMASGGNMTPESNPLKPQFNGEELRAIVDAAHAVGKRVAAHALCALAIRLAVQAGVDTIEHGLWRDERGADAFDPVLAEQMARGGVAVVMTLGGYLRRDLPKPGDEPAVAAFKRERLANFWFHYARLRDMGVRVVAASDAGVRFTPIDDPAAMMELMVDGFGLPSQEALGLLTAEAAAAIGLVDRGTLVPGQRADLLAVAGDPLANPGELRHVRAVVVGGQVVIKPDGEND